MSSKISLIIVTHNSERFMRRCLASIDSQTVAVEQVMIVDSGSDDPSYLDEFQSRPRTSIHFKENIGFAAGNNFGVQCVTNDPHYIVFMNPDIILQADAIEQSMETLSQNQTAAIVSGKLKGYDLSSGSGTGLLDSTGIFRTWYGRWYDRAQGCIDNLSFDKLQEVPALCGAYMFCRTAALSDEGPEIFDETFFMYKEDIDLCLRLRKKGWKMLYQPAVLAFHGRGWSSDRGEVDYRTRCMASRNEVALNRKHRSPYIVWAVLKYLLVRLFHV